MNKNISLKDLYFTIYGAVTNSRKETLVLAYPVNSEKDASIFFPRSLNDISDYICSRGEKFTKNNFIIYISVADDNDIAFIKNKFPNCIKIFVPQSVYQNLADKDKVYHSIEFEKGYELTSPIRQYLSLVENNKAFNSFVEEKGNKKDTITKTIRTLVSEELLVFENDQITFSKTGSILFADDSKFNRKVNIRILNRNNNVDYVLENLIDGPLYFSLNKVAEYIYEKVPTIQTRKRILSESEKPFSINDIKKILMYVFETNDYDSLSQINVVINSIIISVSYFDSNNNAALKKFFKNYFGLESKQAMFSNFMNNGKDIFERKRRGIKTIDFCPFNGINVFSKELDDIDYSIVSFAKNVDYFRRIDIDNRFGISSRNSNIRLNRLVELGILSQSGNGKSTIYNLIK